jgi:hypothetical protein
MVIYIAIYIGSLASIIYLEIRERYNKTMKKREIK